VDLLDSKACETREFFLIWFVLSRHISFVAIPHKEFDSSKTLLILDGENSGAHIVAHKSVAWEYNPRTIGGSNPREDNLASIELFEKYSRRNEPNQGMRTMADHLQATRNRVEIRNWADRSKVSRDRCQRKQRLSPRKCTFPARIARSMSDLLGTLVQHVMSCKVCGFNRPLGFTHPRFTPIGGCFQKLCITFANTPFIEIMFSSTEGDSDTVARVKSCVMPSSLTVLPSLNNVPMCAAS
jgi:hypothetical protein